MGYRDHPRSEDAGSDIVVRQFGNSVYLEMGTMRNFDSLSTEAWASLTPAEAQELADDLWAASKRAEKGL